MLCHFTFADMSTYISILIKITAQVLLAELFHRKTLINSSFTQNCNKGKLCILPKNDWRILAAFSCNICRIWIQNIETWPGRHYRGSNYQQPLKCYSFPPYDFFQVGIWRKNQLCYYWCIKCVLIPDLFYVFVILSKIFLFTPIPYQLVR